MDEVRARRPELPAEKRERFVRDFGVTEYDASVLADDLALAAYFETAAKAAKKPKNVANWILNDLQSALAAAGHTIHECPIAADALDELVNLIDVGVISGKQGKEVFAEMFATGKAASIIVEEKELKQESDVGALEALCQQAIDANPKAVAEYRAGKAASINFLKGQVMKLSQGKANPALVGDLLVKKLS
jgi:aspartyl-tRNA(Asn)/glutamyl-tRNA(Gln) amidotransferase subunit B